MNDENIEPLIMEIYGMNVYIDHNLKSDEIYFMYPETQEIVGIITNSKK